jgi:LysR family glycine cleavage system transcriptional activator
MHKLPPLNAIRAFEAAARHESFTRAARDLHVTPAAVSQQVRLLEEWLGVALFERRHRALRLTARGRDYVGTVRQALGRLAVATEELVSGGAGASLMVGAMASFASRWLVPRLDRFRAAHPGIDVWLVTGSHLHDSEVEDVNERLLDLSQRTPDLTIRYGAGAWPGMSVERLLVDEVFPVCSPAVAQRLGAPADLAGEILLHDILPESWDAWLAHAGVAELDGGAGPTFSHTHDMLRAAALGHGVALGRSALVADALASGELVRPFEPALAATYAYYLVCPPATRDSVRVAAFRSWLLAEVE